MFEVVSEKIANVDVIEMCEINGNKIYLDKELVHLVFVLTGTIKYLPKTYPKFTFKPDDDAMKELKKLEEIMKKDIPDLSNTVKNDTISIRCKKEELKDFNINDEVKIAVKYSLHTINNKNYCSFELKQIKKENVKYF